MVSSATVPCSMRRKIADGRPWSEGPSRREPQSRHLTATAAYRVRRGVPPPREDIHADTCWTRSRRAAPVDRRTRRHHLHRGRQHSRNHRRQSGLKGILEDGVTPANQVGGLGSAITYSGIGDFYLGTPDRGPADGTTSYVDRIYTIQISVTKTSMPATCRVPGSGLRPAQPEMLRPGAVANGRRAGCRAMSAPGARARTRWRPPSRARIPTRRRRRSACRRFARRSSGSRPRATASRTAAPASGSGRRRRRSR
jgi:hypothetical protein